MVLRLLSVLSLILLLLVTPVLAASSPDELVAEISALLFQ